MFAIVYAIFGFRAFTVYVVTRADFFTLPFGLLMPLFHLKVNFNLARSGDVLYNLFLCAAAGLSYVSTG